MTAPDAFVELLEQRLAFLQNSEEALQGRTPAIFTDLSAASDSVTTPLSLQHVGEPIVEIAKADWTRAEGLGTVVAYLGELLELWQTVFGRHAEALSVLEAAPERPYCLFLLSFSEVTIPIVVPGARAVAYLNEPSLPANLAATLLDETPQLNPISCLHTDDLQLLARDGHRMPSFRVHTINWQGILEDAIASSGTILLYVSGASPGVQFEVDRIRKHGREPRTLVVHKGTAAPAFCEGRGYRAVLPVDQFVGGEKGETGPGKLSSQAKILLGDLAASARTDVPPSRRLREMPCEIVDPGMPAGDGGLDPATTFFVTPSNASAFVGYVRNLPDSLLGWNAISQDIRLRGIQPSLDDFNALYRSLRMAFVCSACLGFTASIALTIGLLSKVASMAKPDPSENEERVERYMRVLDIAAEFDALTKRKAWAEKIEAFRDSILEDPFM